MSLNVEQFSDSVTVKSSLIPEGRLADIETVKSLVNFGALLMKPAPKKSKRKSLEKKELMPKEIIKETLDREKDSVVVCSYEHDMPCVAAIGTLNKELGAVIIERLVSRPGTDAEPVIKKVCDIASEELGQQPDILLTEFAELNNEDNIPAGTMKRVGCSDRYLRIEVQ